VSNQALRAELQALRPATGGELARQVLVRDIDPAQLARLRAAAAGVALATRPGSPPQQLALAEARLLEQTVQLVPDGTVRHEATQMGEQRIRDLECWIDANLGEPISLGRLCRVADVGARTLQRVFEHRRGMSPMRFVAERRLAATHRALLRADPGASVTQIALDHGFDHVGRFAQLYQQVLGERPSQTLARPRVPTRAARCKALA
jgi:AraC family ethanolamine operon transcriptional activator